MPVRMSDFIAHVFEPNTGMIERLREARTNNGHALHQSIMDLQTNHPTIVDMLNHIMTRPAYANAPTQAIQNAGHPIDFGPPFFHNAVTPGLLNSFSNYLHGIMNDFHMLVNILSQQIVQTQINYDSLRDQLIRWRNEMNRIRNLPFLQRQETAQLRHTAEEVRDSLNQLANNLGRPNMPNLINTLLTDLRAGNTGFIPILRNIHQNDVLNIQQLHNHNDIPNLLNPNFFNNIELDLRNHFVNNTLTQAHLDGAAGLVDHINTRIVHDSRRLFMILQQWQAQPGQLPAGGQPGGGQGNLGNILNQFNFNINP